MIRYLIFTKKEDGLNIVLSEHYKVEDGEVMAVIQHEFHHNFQFLWEMVKERGESLESTGKATDTANAGIDMKYFLIAPMHLSISYTPTAEQSAISAVSA